MTYMEEDWEDNDTLNNHPGIIIPEHHLKLGTPPQNTKKSAKSKTINK